MRCRCARRIPDDVPHPVRRTVASARIYTFTMDANVKLIKRAIDVVGATAGLVLTAPLFPIIAAAIRLESPGPIFYSQVRAGGNDSARGQAPPATFRMWKFRSMRNDAEKDGRARLAAQGDPRVTRVGRFLRKTRLDELPQ